MRETMTEAGLEDLVDSIRELGILQALLVRPLEDGTYEVVAGHRRLEAARIVGLQRLPCRIFEDADKAIAARVHENVVREDVKPAEEAGYFGEIYERLGQDVDRVCATVKRSRQYVERRLLLLRGWPAVLNELRAGHLTMAQAEALNKCKLEKDALYYLEYTTRAGASGRQIREWIARANLEAERAAAVASGTLPPVDGGPGAPATSTPAGPLYASMAPPWEFSSSVQPRPCLFCEAELPEFKMYRKFVCEPCADRHLVRPGVAGGEACTSVRSAGVAVARGAAS